MSSPSSTDWCISLTTFLPSTFVTSIVRLDYLLQPAFTSPDQTWDMMPTVLWALIELNLLIICPSLFTLPQFGLAIAPSIFSSSSTRSGPAITPKSLLTFDQTMTPGRKYNKYGELFDDTTDRGFDMSALGCSVPTEVKVEGSGHCESLPSSGDATNTANRAWDAKPQDRRDSECCIIQTK